MTSIGQEVIVGRDRGGGKGGIAAAWPVEHLGREGREGAGRRWWGPAGCQQGVEGGSGVASASSTASSQESLGAS